MEPTAESNRSFRLQEKDINVLCVLPRANPRVRARASPRLMGRRGQTYIIMVLCVLPRASPRVRARAGPRLVGRETREYMVKFSVVDVHKGWAS